MKPMRPRPARSTAIVLLTVGLLACGRKPLTGATSRPDASTEAGPTEAGPAEAGTREAGPTEAGGDRGPEGGSASATRPDGTCVHSAFPRGGVCTCEMQLPTVCGDACTDTRVDDDNCGTCGHQCAATATCNDGRCGPVPTIVQPAAGSPCGSIHLALTATALYWSEEIAGKVLRKSLSGGAAEIVATGEERPTWIAVAGTRVIWGAGVAADAGVTSDPMIPASIRTAASTGGPASTVVTPSRGVGGFVASPDGETIYFSTDTTVQRVSAAGGAATVVANDARHGVPRALALDGPRLVYLADVDGDVHVIDLAGAAPAVCASSDGTTGAPNGVACVRLGSDNGSLLRDLLLAGNGQAVWADGPNLKKSDITVARPFADVILETLPVDVASSITTFARAGNVAFFGDSSTVASDPSALPQGIIGKVALTTGALAVALARGQAGITSMVTDGARVYWSTADCAILSTTP
ncbi:MAG: putative serine/threonine-protein kinase pknH [Myxococcales bacterium]|nr:putative serine/threonine-protein kinase pknH [Myxococcales bacterium]